MRSAAAATNNSWQLATILLSGELPAKHLLASHFFATSAGVGLYQLNVISDATLARICTTTGLGLVACSGIHLLRGSISPANRVWTRDLSQFVLGVLGSAMAANTLYQTLQR